MSLALGRVKAFLGLCPSAPYFRAEEASVSEHGRCKRRLVSSPLALQLQMPPPAEPAISDRCGAAGPQRGHTHTHAILFTLCLF